ncbi:MULTISPECIES: ester cyclase [unclassified Roseovarius]|uniref:ester cyclase n=1 Tax=unclassified Roseovarius TaxID=2614913 RepID=UPI00273FC232|nr:MULTISPECIES: ester cyclase [unclassified Roseovarius]
MTFKTMLTSLTIAVLGATHALADDLQVVRSFYADLLTTPADVTPEEVRAVVTEDWESIPTPRGGPGAEGLYKTLGGFGSVIPDLAWEPQEILQDGNRYIVRSIATGTPTGPIFGIDPATGKSFKIMTIDIHTVEDGKIVKSYHVEEWAKAIQQLTAE